MHGVVCMFLCVCTKALPGMKQVACTLCVSQHSTQTEHAGRLVMAGLWLAWSWLQHCCLQTGLLLVDRTAACRQEKTAHRRGCVLLAGGCAAAAASCWQGGAQLRKQSSHSRTNHTRTTHDPYTDTHADTHTHTHTHGPRTEHAQNTHETHTRTTFQQAFQNRPCSAHTRCMHHAGLHPESVPWQRLSAGVA